MSSKQLERNRASVEYVEVPVVGSVTLDMDVEIAVTQTQPEEDDWQAATWQGDPGLERTARTGPVGPLAPGSWLVFFRLTDTPEVPVVLAYSILST